MIQLVDVYASYLSQKKEIDKAIQNTIDNDTFTNGKAVKVFENNFARFCEIKYAIGCSNGTSAIHLALLALGLKKGDRVITVPNTFIATTEAITHVLGQIQFVDVNEETALINIDLIEKAITANTKAIIAVDLFGQMPDMQRLREIANDHNLYLIEDAAQAHGAQWMGRQPGYYSDIATYSFFPAKILGCFGEGGAVTTNNDIYAEKINLLKDHGRKAKYEHLIEGYGYRLDTIQAAILNVKLHQLRAKILERKLNAYYYNSYLHYNYIREDLGASSSYYMYVIKMQNRQKFMKYMQEKSIGTGIHYPIPLHQQLAYKGYGRFPIAEKLAKEIVSIPVYPELTVEQSDYIVETINVFFNKSNSK